MVWRERKQASHRFLPCKQLNWQKIDSFCLLIVALVTETDTAVFREEKQNKTQTFEARLQHHAAPLSECAAVCLLVVGPFTCSIPASLPQSLPLMSCIFFFARRAVVDWRVADCPMHERRRTGVSLWNTGTIMPGKDNHSSTLGVA